MFAPLYGLFSIFCKIGWDIEYSIDKNRSRKIAEQYRTDTYWDKRGKQRLLSNDQVVTTYRNMNGDVMRLDSHRNIVSIVSSHEEAVHNNCTVKKCVDKYGNPIGFSGINVHKNFQCFGDLLQDIKTGNYLVIREIVIKNDLKFNGKKMIDKSKTHLFYMNPSTLELVRETDGEIELRNRGYKLSPSKEEMDKFIDDYNYKLYNNYFEVEEHCRTGYLDIHPKAIDRMISM